VDEFGPLNLQPHPGRQWTARAAARWCHVAGAGRPLPAHTGCATCWPPTTLPATGCTGTSSPASAAGSSWCSCTICAPATRLGVAGDRAGQLQPAPVDRTDRRVADWAAASNVELADVPTNAWWLNRIEAQFQALRSFTLDGTDHTSHHQQATMIRRYIAWRNQHAHNQRLRQILDRAKVA
jgi:hypothetical protein